MTQVLAVIWRFAVIVLGYGTGALTASLFLNLILAGSVEVAAELVAGPSLIVVAFFTLFVAYFAFFPSIVAILAAEMLGRRDWLFYALAGVAVSVAASAFYVGSMGWSAEAEGATDFSLAILGSGVVAGLAYWVVAGRRAGKWRRDLERA